LVTITLLFGLSAVAENFTVLLLGEEWRLTGEFLQILCFAAMFYPLNALNVNIMKVKGRSGLILNIGLLKKVFAVPVIAIAIFYNIKMMLIAMILQQSITYYINTYYGGKLISYKLKEQIIDIFPGLIVSSAMYLVIYLVSHLLAVNILAMLFLEILIGGLFSIVIYDLFKIDGYLYIKKELKEKISKR